MTLALPIILSQVGQVTVGLVDTMMIGHVGTTELAAASFANNVIIFGMLFGMGITIGITPLAGEAYGNGQLGELSKWLKNGMATHWLTAAIFTLVLFFMYFLLPYLGQTEAVVEQAGPYYLILCISYFPFLIFFSFKQFLEGIGNTHFAMQITITANVVNILLNYILIYGKWGFPELGLVGAGIGTLVSRIIMPLMWLVYLRFLPNIRVYFIQAVKEKLEWKRIRKLLEVGIPIGFQIIIEVAAFAVGAIMMGWLGETELAGHQVAIGIATFTFMVCLGISQATTIRVSHQMGLKEIRSIRSITLTSTYLVLLFMTVMAILIIIFRFQLPYLFSTDPEVVRIAATLLIIAAFFQLFDGLQVIMLSVLRGMADVRKPMYLAMLAYLFVALPVSYLFAFILDAGPIGIWYGYLVGLALAGSSFYLRFRYLVRRMEISTPEKPGSNGTE